MVVSIGQIIALVVVIGIIVAIPHIVTYFGKKEVEA